MAERAGPDRSPPCMTPESAVGCEPSKPRKPAAQLARLVDRLPHYRHLQRAPRLYRLRTRTRRAVPGRWCGAVRPRPCDTARIHDAFAHQHAAMQTSGSAVQHGADGGAYDWRQPPCVHWPAPHAAPALDPPAPRPPLSGPHRGCHELVAPARERYTILRFQPGRFQPSAVRGYDAGQPNERESSALSRTAGHSMSQSERVVAMSRQNRRRVAIVAALRKRHGGLEVQSSFDRAGTAAQFWS